MRRSFRSLPVATLVATLLACDRGAPPPATEPTAAVPTPLAARAAEVSRAEVERLQALGYADVSQEPVNDGPSGVVHIDAARSQPGYNLFTNAHLCSTQLIDARGNVVRSWSLEPCFRWDNTSLFPDGDLLVVGRAQKPDRSKVDGDRGWAAGRYVARLGWNGGVVWKTPLGAHHDAQVTPRGEIAVLTAQRRLVPEVDEKRRMKDDLLTLLSLDGAVLAEASLYDLLKTAPPDQFRFQPRTQGKGHLDLLHANSVIWMDDPELAKRDPLYAASNVVVTIRHQDVVVVIDWDARKVVWAWGQGDLSGPHDAVVLPSGNFLVFDNGLGRRWSRIVELDPKTRTIVWEYRAPEPETFYTQTRGANQRLANGNTLIAQSDSGRAFEITPAGEIVWEFLNPNLSEGKRGALVRMRRIDPHVVDGWLARDAGRDAAGAAGGAAGAAGGAAGAPPAAAH